MKFFWPLEFVSLVQFVANRFWPQISWMTRFFCASEFVPLAQFVAEILLATNYTNYMSFFGHANSWQTRFFNLKGNCRQGANPILLSYVGKLSEATHTNRERNVLALERTHVCTGQLQTGTSWSPYIHADG
jgi:hypothetical protein